LVMEAFARLLGAPRLELAQVSYDPPPTKATLLLYYLAYKGEWCSRDELLYLFYPDTAEAAARSNLRQLLTSIRRLPYSEGLETQATRLRWVIATDVGAFKRAVEERQWPKATKLYRGELLEGCTLAGAPEFESWLELEREELREAWREATLSRAGQLREARRYADAAELLEKLHRADPLDEAVLQRCITVLYESGERHKALVTYDAFAQTLERELGSEPEEATLDLARQIKQGEPLGITSTVKVMTQAASVKPRKRPLPLQATPFIGRQVEKTRLAGQLGDESCRLLTIVGAGGMGKTRLAVEVAAMLEEAFTDGVTFIPFASITSRDSIVSTIAGALDFSFFGSDEPKHQLLAYLRNKEMLLVLDNLEHLLENIGLVVEILEAAPNLKLLTTSREPLSLHAEWVYDLEGLSHLEVTPEISISAVIKHRGVEDYEATRLFVQSAKMARAGFVLDQTDAPAVARICQLVKGMPLALELAAGWLRILPLEDIVAEIERGLDLLEASTRDLPSRHRSLRAVFDHSWHLLSEGERQALRRLSVFRGGFTRQAAAHVAEASLPLLLSLRNKSLLKANALKRHEWHPLVWQYSKERADAYPDEQAETLDRHCAYYAEFLHGQTIFIQGGEKQREAHTKIEGEIDNVRAAWRWAIERRDRNALELARGCLERFFYVRGLFKEGEEAFTAAVACLDWDSVTLCNLLVAQSVFAAERKHPDEAQEAGERSLAMLERLGEPPYARVLLQLGCVHFSRGNYTEAERLHLEGLAVAKAGGDLYGMGCNLNMLALIAVEQGQLERAEGYYNESIAAFRQRQDRWGLTLASSNLGLLLANLGRHKDAEMRYHEGLENAKELGNLPGTAFTLTTLGDLNFRQKKYRQAQTYYLESLSIWRGMDSPNVSFALYGLGETARALENHQASLSYFTEAVTTAAKFGDRQDAVAIVVDVAAALLSLGDEEKAHLLLTFALKQQGIDQEVVEKARRLMGELQSRIPQETIAAAEQMCQNLTLEKIQKMVAAPALQVEQHSDIPTS
jgi:predicted ATPase/DNA-binding SARP family transcriptional activator